MSQRETEKDRDCVSPQGDLVGLDPRDAAVVWGGDIDIEIGCDLVWDWPPLENCKFKIGYS